MKRLLALVLSMVFLLTALPLGAVSVAAEEYPYLQEGVIVEAQRDFEGYSRFYFTPAESDHYVWQTRFDEQRDARIAAYVCDMNWETIASDYEPDGQGNVRVDFNATAGETYILVVISDTQFTPVCVTKEAARTITNVEFLDDTVLMCDMQGEYIPRMRVTYSDGTVEEETTTYMRDDEGNYYDIYVDYTNESPEEMEIGGTYTLNGRVDVGGVGVIWQSDFTITIAETPVASVEIGPYTVIEHQDGYWAGDLVWDEETGEESYYEYFQYNVFPNSYSYDDITITLKDGTVIHETGFMWNGRWYYLGGEYQSYDNQLSLGINERTCSIAGYEGTYTVNIIDSLIVSVEMDPIVLVENVDGYWRTDSVWDDEALEYVDTEPYFDYEYSPGDYVRSITLCDGTVLTGEDGWGFYWNDGWYSFDFEYDSYENQLQFGINELTYSIAGYEGTYTVEVIDTPVASHSTDVIYINENQNGEWLYEEGYFWYSTYSLFNDVLLTMKDGTKVFVEDCGYGVEIDQSYENRLLPGRNEVTFTIAGYTGTCIIEVVPSSVSKVTVETIVYAQYADAELNYSENWDPELEEYIREPYFRYEVRPDTITVTFKDGKTATYETDMTWWSEYPLINHNGETYDVYIDMDSLWNSDWGLGVHTVQGMVMGCPFTYTVEVVERPTDSIYEYVHTQSGIIITDCYFPEETMEIPATIDGYTVVGVADLPYEVKYLTLPDTVATVGEGLLSHLYEVAFGAGVKNLHAGMFEYCYELQSVIISPANPYFTIIDGAVYDKAGTTFIGYPMGSEDLTHTVPNTAVDLGALSFNIYDDLSVTLAEGNPNAVTIDGVTYDKGLTRVLFCDPAKEGAYVMPSTVTEIAEAAFRGCSNLTEVTISPGVTSIVYCAFEHCGGLEVVNLPEGLVSIERRAFADTVSLTSVDLPETLTTIGSEAFAYSGLNSLTLPDATKMVAYQAFYGSDLITVDLGKGVEYIGESAFAGTSLTDVVLPDSLTYLGGEAFCGCASLKSVSIGRGLTTIESSTFGYSGLESIDVPSNIRCIDDYAFVGCANLRQVTLHKGLESIGEFVFFECASLEEIVIPDSVVYLGRCAFKVCTSLTRAVIGAGITYIDEDTFFGCPLEELDFRGRLDTIGTFAFAYGDMTSLVLPDSVTSIMYCAFWNCDALEDIRLPDSVTDVGGGAFHGTAWYNGQEEGMTYLSHVAYYWKGAMAPESAIAIPEDITVLADWALSCQPNLVAAKLPQSLRVIGDFAFREDMSLTTLQLGDNVEEIQSYAFYRCVGLTDVYYTGSEADRSAIDISDGNEALMYATWHYNICQEGAHVYDNYCDNTCNQCDWVRPDAPGHTYRNECDTDCDNCGLTRTPPHKYSDVCDAVCNGCGLTREPPHQYSDAYDTDCDLCGAVREMSALMGDANGDGKINIRDLGLIQQHLNGWDVELDLTAADANGDGKVNIRDLGLIQQYLNGWNVELG